MGNSVSSRLEWSSSLTESGKIHLTKDGLPQLQTSIVNQDILYDLANMVEQLCHNYPVESKAEFKAPIVWTTRVLPSAFISHSSASIWVVKEASK